MEHSRDFGITKYKVIFIVFHQTTQHRHPTASSCTLEMYGTCFVNSKLVLR